MTESGYRGVERFLSEVTGLDPESLGTKSIANAVDALMEAAQVARVDDYLAALKSGRENLEDLLEKVVVPETWFFRERESFNYLRTYVEEAGFLRFVTKPLRLLSAPCSTGEEPYSIAMALLDMGLPPERFRINAVDISARAIEIAKKAVYGKGSFRGEGGEQYESYFSRTEEGLRVAAHVTGLIHFCRDNLAMDHALPNHEPYDIVFCKNLLIYLTENGRRRLMANIERLLVPGGILFAGNSEVVSFLQNGYRPVRHAMSFACEKAGKALQQEPSPARPFAAEKKPPLRAAAEIPPPAAKREKVPEKGQSIPVATSLHDIRALADRGALDEALKRCEQFLGEHRHHKEGYCLMGVIHFALNSFTRAEEFFQKVLYLDPYHYEALVHMGLLYEKKGDRGKASIMRGRIERSREKEASGQEAL